MATSAAVTLRPYNEAPRRALVRLMRGTTFDVINSENIDSPETGETQPGRIIATHWLRSENEEVAHA